MGNYLDRTDLMGGRGDEDSPQSESGVDKAIEEELGLLKGDDCSRLLLVGVGRPGKTTVFNQMRLWQRKGFGKPEREWYRANIYNQVCSSMKALLEKARQNGRMLEYRRVGFLEAKGKSYSSFEVETKFDELQRNTYRLTSDYVQLLSLVEALWQDAGVRESFRQYKSELNLPPNIAYFFDNSERLSKSSYLPSDEDIFSVAAPKTNDNRFTYFTSDQHCHHYCLIDIGGARKQWGYSRENVSAVIYCVDISDYDKMVHQGDNVCSSLHESLELFEKERNSDRFEGVPFFLLLNKIDLLKAKILEKDMTVCFPNYTSGNDYQKAAEYIRDQFLSRSKGGLVYPFFTSALDSGDIRRVFRSMISILNPPPTLVDQCSSVLGQHWSKQDLSQHLNAMPQELRGLVLRHYVRHNATRLKEERRRV